MNDLPKLGIIAGGGEIPRILIESCRNLGRSFFVVCIEGHAAPGLAEDSPHVWLPLGAGAKLKEIFKKEGITEVIMIGRVKRPSFTEIKPDWFTLKVLAKIGMNSLGDDGLLRAIGKVFEDEGIKVVGVKEVLSNLLTPKGVLTNKKPDEQDCKDILVGIKTALELGLADKGQAVIVRQGIVLGKEDAEGTDALIRNCMVSSYQMQSGVLVKMAKPQQDERFDLPTIGLDTIVAIAKAGLSGIAIETGRSIIVEREKTIAEADKAGLFIVGVSQDGKINE